MPIHVVDFDIQLIPEAAELLQQRHQQAIKTAGYTWSPSKEFYTRHIHAVLESQEVSGAYMVLQGSRFAGFAIAEIIRSEYWGDGGWINPGSWAVDKEYPESLFPLYQKIGEKWVKQNIRHHYIMTYAHDRLFSDLLNDLGFARQQAHGILSLEDIPDCSPAEDENGLILRKATVQDQSAISGFSRLIAEYQTKAPCFASAPEDYLRELDKGFAELTADKNIDLYVAEHAGEIAGYQAYEETQEPGLLIPPNSVELIVSGVRKEYRGKGAGRRLTAFGLLKQKEKGYDYVITDWRCANLLSGKFWKAAGFTPAAYRLYRCIDPRIRLQV